MRRISIMLLALLAAVSLLVLPGQSASAEDPVRVERLHAVVIGFTDPDPNEHMLAVNRVTGESEFRNLQINGELECDGPDPEVVRFNVVQPPGHGVRFTTDDDPTDGHGQVHDTEDRGFRDDAATAVRAGGQLSDVRVEIRILGGDYHRVGNYVDVNLRLDVRVEAALGGEICEDEAHEIRITFLIVGPAPPPATEGFTLVGVARTHELPDDRESIARKVCDAVAPYSTRIEDPANTINSTIPDVSSTIPHGRGDFHPCERTPPG